MKDLIVYNDFEKLDVRVGKVVSATAPEWSSKLLRMEVNLGGEIGQRILFSGIRKWYSPEDVIGKNMQFVINMAPKKMGEEESQGMLIMADTDEKPVLIFLPDELEPGTMIR